MTTELETVNKLFLELSQFATAKTARELALEVEVERLMGVNVNYMGIINRQNSELAEARRLLDEARKQEPVAIQYQAVNGNWYSVTERQAEIASGEFDRPIRKLYAAPVPAQPSVPDDVAKDAAEVVAYRIHYPGGAKRLTEDGDVYEHEKRAGLKIDWLGVVGGIDAASKGAKP